MGTTIYTTMTTVTTDTLSALARKNGEEFEPHPLEVWITLRGYRFRVLAASVIEGDFLDLEISDTSEEHGRDYSVACLTLAEPDDGSDDYNPDLDIRAPEWTANGTLPDAEEA